MGRRNDSAGDFDVRVTAHGELRDAGEYARRKVGALAHLIDQPVLDARVRLTRHADPAVARPVVAQANLDVNGRPVRAQVGGATAREAIDRLEVLLRNQLERAARDWEARRGGMPSGRPDEWRRQSEPAHRLSYFPRPPDQRQIMRRKSFTLATSSIDDAALEMDLLDYDFHLFTEKGTRQDSVLYRAGPTGYRLAQVSPVPAEQLAPFRLPLTVSPQPAVPLSPGQASERLGLLGLPFLFFVDTTNGHGSVLYHRYDGHYGLISPAD